MTDSFSIPISVDVDVDDQSFEVEVETDEHQSYEAESDSVIIVKDGKTTLPAGGKTGDLLAKASDSDYDMNWITPADRAEQDNTRPITAAAVYTEIGNINALLATI